MLLGIFVTVSFVHQVRMGL